MKKGQPITPDEIPAAKAAVIPDFVFDAFNELLVLHWNAGRAIIKQSDIIAKILKDNNMEVTDFNYDWLNVEDAYCARGWHVDYNSLGHGESYPATFTFSKRN